MRYPLTRYHSLICLLNFVSIQEPLKASAYTDEGSIKTPFLYLSWPIATKPLSYQAHQKHPSFAHAYKNLDVSWYEIVDAVDSEGLVNFTTYKIFVTPIKGSSWDLIKNSEGS